MKLFLNLEQRKQGIQIYYGPYDQTKYHFATKFFSGQGKFGAHSCRAPTVPLKYNRGQRNNVYLKYLYQHFPKFNNEILKKSTQFLQS